VTASQGEKTFVFPLKGLSHSAVEVINKNKNSRERIISVAGVIAS
jgi:hypothetical protein